MAQNSQVSQEYLILKVFLYKYTPPFSQVTLPPATTGQFSLSTFKPYSIPLDDTQYFTKYDISNFVTDYSFEQNIDETTYSWSVTLQDLALSNGTINNSLKVTPISGTQFSVGSSLKNGLSFSNSSDALGLLAEYETGANTFNNNTDPNSDTTANPIFNAKAQRGMSSGPLTVQNTNLTSVLSTVSGLRLSDLIQEYDFISLFLYKNQTPITSIYGTISTDYTLTNNPIQIFNYSTTSDTPPFDGSVNLSTTNLQQESVLLTKMPNGNTLFSNEFNGFVMKKNISSSISQVDKVTVSGNGWSRLFGASRRAVKTSLFANALYQAGQATGLDQVTPFETIYAGQPIGKIVQDLFDTVYRIDFNTTTNADVAATSVPINPLNSTNLKTSTGVQAGFFSSPLGSSTPSAPTSSFAGPNLPPLGSSFYNITSLIAGNAYPANLFTLPQYLLSTVMKLRPFAYLEPIDVPPDPEFINAMLNEANTLASVSTAGTANTGVSPETWQQITQSVFISQQVANYVSTSPVFIDPNVQNLRAYFRFLDTVFLNFSPELQTPYQILDQIRSIAFVEIYEQPNGQFIVRSPQYNNMATSVSGRSDIGMVRSSNLNIITTNYMETVENLVSKILTGYSPDFTPVGVLQQFGYCDGKLLIQNGQLEMDTAANPNAASASPSDTTTNNSRTTGIFGWAEYLMELSNAKLKTGAIVCDLDNTIQVGNTFIDETKFKFGYVIGISKHVSVTGTATMTLSLSYVRDAVPLYNSANAITDINVDLLPVLIDIENSFSGS